MSTPTTTRSTTKNLGAALSGLSGAQYALVAVVVAGVLLLAGSAGYGQVQQTGAWDDTPVCSEGGTADCLTPVEGSVRSSLVSGEKTYYFYPDADTSTDVSSRTKLGDQRKWGATTFDRALYDGDDLVGLEAHDGDREYRGGLFTTFGWYLVGAGAGLVMVLVGIGLLARGLLRR